MLFEFLSLDILLHNDETQIRCKFWGIWACIFRVMALWNLSPHSYYSVNVSWTLRSCATDNWRALYLTDFILNITDTRHGAGDTYCSLGQCAQGHYLQARQDYVSPTFCTTDQWSTLYRADFIFGRLIHINMQIIPVAWLVSKRPGQTGFILCRGLLENNASLLRLHCWEVDTH